MFLKIIEKKISFVIKKITEYPLKEIADHITNNKINQTIPNNVYQTWENRFFGKSHYKEMIKFRKINKDFNFYLFDKELRDKYMKDHWSDKKIYQVYLMSNFGQMKADIFRYCILYDKGGYYFDISKGCKVPLNTLHSSSTEALISNEPIECILPPKKLLISKLEYPLNNFLQWGLGFKKKHPIPMLMINAIVADFEYYLNLNFEKPKIAILALSGTGQFTKIVRNYIYDNGAKNIVQSGIYFNGQGIFSMKGSRVRHHYVKEYADVRNKSIFKN